MTLKEYLFKLFYALHRGKRRAVLRIDLLDIVQYLYGEKITDREMRLAYEDLPICGSSKGLYLPETKAEIDEQICLHMKKVYSYWRKIKVLRDYKIDSDSVQKNLF